MVDAVFGRLLESKWRRRSDPRPQSRPFRLVVRVLRWAVALAALTMLCWGLAAEARTSYLQSRIFSNLTRDMSFAVQSGPSRTIRFPKRGPYDERLGYAGLPVFIASLSAVISPSSAKPDGPMRSPGLSTRAAMRFTGKRRAPV